MRGHIVLFPKISGGTRLYHPGPILGNYIPEIGIGPVVHYYENDGCAPLTITSFGG